MKAILALITLAVSLSAQDFPEQSITFRAGGAFPSGKLLRGLDNRPLLGLGYGYRWNRHVQFDLGFDNVFKPFNNYLNDNRLPSGISQHLFLVPVGVRGIMPFADDRFHVFAGGGGAYMRYQISSSSALTAFCGICQSRDLGGYYVQAGGNAALDYSRRFRVGGSIRYYTGYASTQGFHTIDRWWTAAGEFTYTFK
jgi:hypothetical protein